MANLNNLMVTDVQDLRTEASNFDQHATEVQNLTDKMLELVESTDQCWRGEARDRYNNQFQNLRYEMKQIYDMCHEYYTDLMEIAKNYEAAETASVEIANSLAGDITMI